MTNQMKATEQYFPMLLFILLYKVVLTFVSVDGILSVTNQMKAIEKYFCLVSCSNFEFSKWESLKFTCPIPTPGHCRGV